MDQTKLQQQIALYYSKLPPNAQEVFSSMKWMDTLKNISTKYGLKDNQIETLGTETTLALLGIIHLDEYEDILTGELRLPRESLDRMFAEINQEVFRPISQELVDTFDTNATSLVEEKYGKIDKLDERFEKLPKQVQVAISESGYQATLREIANKHKLSIEQMGILEEVTVKVLLGIIHPDQYEEQLGSKIGLPAEKVAEIITDVNDQILKTIREILKKHWSDNEEGVVSPDDEVPIPPYAVSSFEINKKESITSTPENAWERSREPSRARTPISRTESRIYEHAGIEIVDDMGMLGDKLKGITVSRNTVSNHSLPKVSTQTAPTPPVAKDIPTIKAHDPYHETID